jgi:D-beta-D-heptose 7-phosphate kinase/D-beta-D-heptose 1-phosphate adenosyltransferase
MTSLDPARANDLVRRFESVRLLVLGDLMLDRFIVGQVTRISPEAPVPIVRFESEHVRLGGAANVAHNVAALGGRVSVAGVIGADAAGDSLLQHLRAASADTSAVVIDAARRTTEKVRVVTRRNQQVARIDYEDDTEISGDIETRLVAMVKQVGATAHAILVSDYLKGAVTRATMDAARALAATGTLLIVDPKIPHLSIYGGVALITPNSHEAETATHRRIRSDDEARDAAREFRARAGCGAVLITRGEHGMWFSDATGEQAIAATAREVADVTGAGDTVAATLALAAAVGAPLVEAAMLANHAAGIVVGKFGAATVTPAELIDSIRRAGEAARAGR